MGAGVDGYKQAELTRTKFIGKVKGSVYGLMFLSVFSVLFWAIIWKLAPIPSGSYLYVQRMWPLFAQMQALWVKVLMERGGELTQYKEGKLGDEESLHTYESLIEHFPKSVNTFVEDNQRRLWVGVVNKGMRVFDMERRRWYRIIPRLFIEKGFERPGIEETVLTLPAQSV